MKITGLTFEKRWNLGDYNHENLIATAGVEENENPSTALKNLIAFVRTKGVEEVEAAPITSSPSPKVQEVKDKKEAKETKTKTETKETKVKVEEKKVEETGKETSNGEEKSEESSQVKSEEKKSEKEKIVKKNKGVPYDPDNNQHKKLVGEFLDKASPSWRANTAPAKAVSQTLRGDEFQDAEGLIMEEFKTKFLEELKKQK